ncbi:RIP metalloprotease [Thermotoga sp. KOL6]|uniref:M50 family metallopeptidase n=1 Tax=Thermotoga sp. KOL6 TaxID=126741 RepID=UPI000C7572EF|nr:site-2 protease family protein [Thermotoga sp. KOL6]PLV58369.1 zinc protease [Thermotoga sp. KOL6]
MVIVYFILILTGVIMVHEFGHYLFAKLFKVKVLEFALGFGPKIFSVKGKETVFRFNVFPIGGYVRMLGEEGEEIADEKEREKSFYSKPAWQRLLITFAGPLFSIVAGYVLFLPITLYWGITLPGIDEVLPGSPAEEAGLKKGDIVYSINGKIAFDTTIISSEIQKGLPVEMLVMRNGRKKPVLIEPRMYPKTYEIVLESVEGVPKGKLVSVNGNHDISILREYVNEFVTLEFENGLVKGILKSFTEIPERYMIGISFAGLSPVFREDFYEKGNILFRKGDRILEVEGQRIDGWQDLIILYQRLTLGQNTLMISIQGDKIEWWRGLSGTVKVLFKRNDKLVEKFVDASSLKTILETPNVLEPQIPRYKPKDFFETVGLSIKACNYVLFATVASLKNFFRNVQTGQIVGVVGLAGVISQASKSGMEAVLTVVAIITISLGVLNLLPLPALDGGRIIFSLVEMVTRRKLDPRVENIIHFLGFIFLMLLFLYITFLDIGRLMGI